MQWLHPSTYRQRGVSSRTIRPRVVSSPAPVGGLNTRDSLSAMPASDAIVMDNFIPGFGEVALRRGYQIHADGIGSGNVESVMVYESGADNKLLAAGGGGIFDATTSGSAISLVSGLTSNRWEHAVMSGRMALLNGSDAPREYDGSSISTLTISGTGLTPADLIGVTVHQFRSYFWERESQSFWYSATLALAGALTEFPLGDVATFGGSIVTIESLSANTESGLAHLLAIIFSSGQVVVYAGSDPGDPTDFALQGIYRIGRPVNKRAVSRVGGDLVVATSDGYVSLSREILSRRGESDYSDKIAPLVANTVAENGDAFGWQMIYYPPRQLLMVNVPELGGTFTQHTLNLQTGAWCRLVGQNGSSWAVYDDKPYFGWNNGRLCKADVGSDDNGDPITGTCQSAFFPLSQRGTRARLNLLRLQVRSSGQIDASAEMDVDYLVTTGLGRTYRLGTGGITPWGSPWGSPWSASVDARQLRLVRSELGDAFSVRMSMTSTVKDVAWTAYHLTSTPAGVL